MPRRRNMAPQNAGRKQAAKVVRRLHREYPDAECALRYQNPVQLLVATILSAQCTDQRVNMVTDKLFRDYPTAVDLASLPQKKLESAIQSTGFFRNKAKSIKTTCQRLVDDFDGKVPRDMTALIQLPGVGRKTANVVMGTAFGQATGVVVDTHVGRISRRVGLTDQRDPVKAERDLMDHLPRKEWIGYSHRMIQHGRRVCKARRPLCDHCCLEPVCPRIGVVG